MTKHIAEVTEKELQALDEIIKGLGKDTDPAPSEPEKETTWKDTLGGVWDAIHESFTGDKKIESLKKRGLLSPEYDREEAPLGALARGSVNPQAPGKAVETLRAIDETEFERPDIAGGYHGGIDVGKAVFTYDKETNQVLWKQNPDVADWTLLNAPGLSPGDFAELLGDAPAILGETLGYLAARKFKGGGPVWKAIKRGIGLGSGAAAGENVRLAVGRFSGAQEHLSEKEKNELMWKEGLKASGLAVAGAVATRTGYEVYKFAKGIPPIRWIPGVKGRNLPFEFKERGMALPENIPPIIDKINLYLDPTGKTKRFKPDSAVTLNDPDFMAVVDDLARSGTEGWNIVKDLYVENLEALVEVFDKASPMAAGIATAYGAGVSGTRALREAAERGEAGMRRQLVAADEGEADALTVLHADVGDPGTSVKVGASIRSPFETKQVELQDWADLNYSNLAKEVGDARFYPKSLADETAAQKNLFDLDLIKKTTAENRTIVDNLLEIITTVKKTPTGGTYPDISTVSYQQLTRAISHLKTLERNANKGMNIGLNPGVEVKALTDLRMAAMADKTRRLELMPDEVAHRHLALDEAYAAKKKELTTGVVQKLLAWRKGSQEVQDSSVFRNIFGKDDPHYQASVDVAAVLKESRNIGAFDDVKGSIYAKFVKENTDSATGRINPNSAKNWLEDHAQSLSSYMSPTEIAVMSNAKTKSGLLKKMQVREKNFNARMKKSPAAVYSKTDESTLFDKIFRNAASFEHAQKVFARQFPHEWEMMKGAGVSRLKSDITSRDSAVGDYIIDFKKLDRVLNDSDYVRKIEILGGKQYVDDLLMLREGAEILARNPGRAGYDPDSAFSAIARAIWPPLSHTPFLFKKLKQAVTITQRRNLMDVILDPQLLAAASKSTTNTAAQRARQSTFGGAAALWWRGAIEEDVEKALDPESRLIYDVRKIVKNNPNLKAKIESIMYPQ